MPGLLFVLAHPDDETISAGTIAKYASAGVPAGLVCATRGERGSTAGLCTIEQLPQLREREVREAARLLGISEVELLPYEDQKLWSAPLDEIRLRLVTVIRRQRPQIVITFDPNGANQHTDHMSISRFVTDAISAAADPRWYPDAGASHTIERLLWQWLPAPHAELHQHPGADFVIDIAAYKEKKQAAFRAHRTQLPGLEKLFSVDPRLARECFRLGWGPRPGAIPADDLFAGFN